VIPALFIHLLVEREREEGREKRGKESDVISNSAETAKDCKCVTLFSGRDVQLCVAGWERQNTPPRIRCTTKASVMSAFVYWGMFLLISCVFNSAFQSCRPGLNCVPWRYHKSNPGP